MLKMNFFKKLNPFNRKHKQEPETAALEITEREQRRVISKRNRVGWKPQRYSKFRNKGTAWWVKIGLSSKPVNVSLHLVRSFGTFSKCKPFRANGRALAKG